ncbi:MAG: hypothetical protein WCC48_00730, partial [Anaeromyxobacteraceae bacterium]
HAVPKAFGMAFSLKRKFDGTMSDNKSKSYLTKVFSYMTDEQISARDPNGEIAGWFSRMVQTIIK